MNPGKWLAVMLGTLTFYLMAIFRGSGSDNFYGALTFLFVAASLAPMLFVRGN